MITVRIIQYWNDYHKKELRERFENLDALADWIFSQMQVDYSQKNGRDFLSFPRCKTDTEIYEISVRPNYGGHVFWIKQIEDDYRGILFSDGTFTAGQKHCTKDVREWLAGCVKRRQDPVFRFATDIAEHPSPFTEKFVPDCFHFWELADGDSDGVPCRYKPGILVNFFGTFITTEDLPVDCPEWQEGFIGSDNEWEFTGESYISFEKLVRNELKRNGHSG